MSSLIDIGSALFSSPVSRLVDRIYICVEPLPASPEMIRTYGLGKRFDGVWGVRGLSITVEPGSVTMLLGPNGSGKTTTVRLLATVYRPTEGDAEVLGLRLTRDYRRIRRLVSYLPQEVSLYNMWTPMDAVKWVLVARGYPRSAASSIARDWMERLGIWEYRDRKGWALSGGMKRRVLLAMALAPESEVVFLDEPTTGIDLSARVDIWRVIREEARSGRTILLTTHDMMEGEALADKVVLLHSGHVLVEAPLKNLLDEFPYRYKVVLQSLPRDIDAPVIPVGDKYMLLTRSREEALEILSQADGVGEVSKTGLAEYYLYLSGGGDEEA